MALHLTRKTTRAVYINLKKNDRKSGWEMDSATKHNLMKNVVPRPVTEWIQINKKINYYAAKYLPIFETLDRVVGHYQNFSEKYEFFIG